MPGHFFKLLTITAVALLPGCARDAFVVQTGTSFVEAGEPVTREANRVLGEVAKGSRESLVAIAVRNPSCDWPELRIAKTGTGLNQPLCAATGADTLVTLKLLKRSDFAPTLAILSAFAGYVEAVQAIVSEEPFDANAELDSARADLQAVGGDIAIIAGAPAPTFLTDGQFAAVKAMVGLIGQLRQERDQVKRLKLVEAQAPDVDKLVQIIGQDIDRWVNLGLVSDLTSLKTAQRIEWNRVRATAGADDRARLLGEQIAADDKIAAAQALPVQLRQMLAETDSAYDLYLQALGERELSPQARRQIAKLTQARLRTALKAITRTLASFFPGV